MDATKDIINFSSDALPSTVRVLSFTGYEAISRPYRFEVNLGADHAHSQAVDLDAAIGKRATLTIDRQDDVPPYVVHGVIASLESVVEHADGGIFRAVIVPKLWNLSLNQHSRIFVGDSVTDIVRDVLEYAGFSSDEYEFRCQKTYKPIEHVCQYKESYLNFISRWMEREGLYYYFEQGTEHEKLIITDTKTTHVSLRTEPVIYRPIIGEDSAATEALESFTCKRRVLPGKVSVDDYNYLMPSADLVGHSAVEPPTASEVVRFGDNVLTANDSKRMAELRGQELLAQQSVFLGSGPVFELRSGYTFTLDEHARAAFNTKYLVTELTHKGNQYSGAPEFKPLLGIETDDRYRVDVVGIPATVQYRAPSVTPLPRIYGIEEAVVDGEQDHHYAQIDEHGRYKVKINFDEGDLRNGKASTWIRMIQPHGGNPEGLHFPLRKHTEVLLVFLGGDPDRPAIVGAGHNTEKPSVVNRANNMTNVFHTGGDNRFELHDEAGSQHVRLQCPVEDTNIHMGAPRNGVNFHCHTTGHSRHDTSGNNHREVGMNNTINVTINHFETCGADRKEETGGDRTETIEGNSSETVSGNVEEKIGGNRNEEITGNTSEKVNGNETTTILGNSTETVNGNVTETINSSKSETHYGNSTELTIGITSDTNIGAFAELRGGLSVETFIGIAAEMYAAIKLEQEPVEFKTAMTYLKTHGFDLEETGFKIVL